MKKILSALSICLVVLCSFFLTACGEQKSTPTSVMTMSVNPEVQFVLDQNNKVVNVTATNEDGEKLIALINFKGKTADEASKLFVQISTELSANGTLKTDIVNGKGTQISIYISAEKETEKIKELKTKVQNSVNQYFKDNGIIAGAKIVEKDIKDAINNYGKQVEDLSKKSYAELVSYANELARDLENISYEVQNSAMEIINQVKNSFKDLVDSAEKTIDDLNTLLENNKLLAKDEKAKLQKQLNDAKQNLINLKNQIQEEINTKLKDLKNQGKQAIETLKAELNTAISNGKELLKAHKDEFNKHKVEIIKQIESFQVSLLSE